VKGLFIFWSTDHSQENKTAGQLIWLATFAWLPLGLDLLSGLEATFNWLLLFSLPSGLEAMFWLSFGLLSIAWGPLRLDLVWLAMFGLSFTWDALAVAVFEDFLRLLLPENVKSCALISLSSSSLGKVDIVSWCGGAGQGGSWRDLTRICWLRQWASRYLMVWQCRSGDCDSELVEVEPEPPKKRGGRRATWSEIYETVWRWRSGTGEDVQERSVWSTALSTLMWINL